MAKSKFRTFFFSSFSILLWNSFELDEELYIACAIINESLYDTNADKKKVVRERIEEKFDW
jgi:hypothetical protein